MEEINDYSFITEIKDKIKKSGKYSFEELKDSIEMQIWETLQNFIKKYIETLIKSKKIYHNHLNYRNNQKYHVIYVSG